MIIGINIIRDLKRLLLKKLLKGKKEIVLNSISVKKKKLRNIDFNKIEQD